MSQHDAIPVTADPVEIERFDILAADWWNEQGPMAPLHRLNPVRLSYIRDRITDHLGLDAKAKRPLAGLSVLDIGCGCGLLAEPLSRMGAKVVGIDLAPSHIEQASQHAALSGLEIDYRLASAEQLAGEGKSFDLVCALEVVEHVADQDAFLQSCAALVRPGNGEKASGGMVLATLNRTARSFALGIVAAEYILGWLPRGTHSWSRFVRPSEAARSLRKGGLSTIDITGVAYDPLRDRFRLSDDPAVNYMMFSVSR
ncbi:MAG: bifunctional 2-polyprenyl-6-hydroxyphenol methylase/3-demethylubiquinol 3-O-methyltransferase UbiG [Geminicoccaceae bacterium]